MGLQSTKHLPFLRRKLILVGCVLIASILGGCSIYPNSPQVTPQPATVQDVVVHDEYSNEVWLSSWTEQESGVKIYNSTQAGLGFVRPEDRHTTPNELPQNAEIHKPSGEPLSLDLVVNAARKSTFLITAILDYRQVPFTLDGKPGLLHEIEVGENGFLYIPIQIEIDEPGAHDLILLGFQDPYQRPWDPQARNLVMGCLTSSRRTVVIVDGVSEPFRTIAPDVYGAPPPPEVDFGVPVLFAYAPEVASETAAHPSEGEQQMKMTAHGKAGDLFKYRLWLSNYELPDDVVDYGFIRFLDYHQIDFKGKDLFVAHFDGPQETIVEDSLVLPAQAGVHEVQIVHLFDPYRSLLQREVLDPFVSSSSCLGIQVE